jgi:pimeloyl-ACP methyl ester carboxylesterase
MLMHRMAICGLGGVALLLTACTENAPPPLEPTLALEDCRVAGIESAVKCATVSVPEDRSASGGRNISLRVVVLPATSRNKSPDPIFWFAGGPSQAASEFARPAQLMLGGLNSKRDIVLVDQRGTGQSNGLHCDMGDTWANAKIEVKDRATTTARTIQRCREELSKRADLTRYTTTLAMADIDAVREALGYREINLWGGSYGTRAAQEYLRRYPDRVRSVVLDGVAPPALILGSAFAADAARAYESGTNDCAKDPRCAKRYPQWGDEFAALSADLKQRPQRVRVADPHDGQARDIIVDDEMVEGILFTSLYAPEALSLMPHAIAKARAGDFAPLMALGSLLGGERDDKNGMGMRLSVVCAEDIPRLATAKPMTHPEPFGDFFVREFRRACDQWPRGNVDADFYQPVQSAKPVLILSGGLDPVTPPSYGEDVKKTFSNALHLIAPNVGHGVSGKGCAPKLVKQFVEKASVAGLDGECLKRLPRPGFFEPPLRVATPAPNP